MRKMVGSLCNSSTCLSCSSTCLSFKSWDYWRQGICIQVCFTCNLLRMPPSCFCCPVPTTMCLLYLGTKHLWIMLCPKTNNTNNGTTNPAPQTHKGHQQQLPFFFGIPWPKAHRQRAKDHLLGCHLHQGLEVCGCRFFGDLFARFLRFPSKDSGGPLRRRVKASNIIFNYRMCR